jgi:hypothetical protein
MRESLERFSGGCKASFRGHRRAAATASFGIIFFLLAVIASSYKVFFQMLSLGSASWSEALLMPYWTLLSSSGYTGVGLTLVFSVLTAVALTNTGTKLLRKEFDTSLLGAIPGFAAAGCATCGVGLVSVLGLGGILATLPFDGNLVRLGTIGLLTALIARNGDPDRCDL